MRWSILVLFVLFFPLAKADIIVSEIMYNSNNGSEWIELYTENEINFSNSFLKDNYYVDDIICCKENCSFLISNNSFFVIGEYDEQEDFFDFCVDDNSIGNGLGNNGDEISIFSESQIYVNFTYNQSITKGFSLSLINSTYLETIPTPKQPNKYSAPVSQPKIIPYLERGMTNNEYYLFKLENNYDEINTSFFYNVSCVVNDSVIDCQNYTEEVFFKNTKAAAKHKFEIPGEYLICGTLFSFNECYYVNISDSSTIPCNISLWIEIEKEIYEKNEKIEYYIKLSNTTYSYDIEYWIEDIFKENIKKPYLTTNTNKRTYTPKFNQKEKPLILRAKLKYISCNNSAEKISDSVLIAVQGSDEKISQEISESLIEIEMPENENYFGEIIYPKFKIIKGETSKYSIKIYLLKENKKSEPVSLYLYGKNKEIELKLPFLLDFSKQEEGEYYLVAEGLDIIEKTPLKIMKKQTSNTLTKSNIEVIYFSENITNETTLILNIINNDEKAKKYEIWSYVYSGPTSYSGNRTQNKQTLLVEPSSSKTYVLKNYLTEIPEKDLKIKINILEEGKKTPTEIIKNVSLKNTPTTELIYENTTEEKTQNLSLNAITGQTIYKSSSAKLKDYSSYFLIAVIILSVFAIFKLKRI